MVSYGVQQSHLWVRGEGLHGVSAHVAVLLLSHLVMLLQLLDRPGLPPGSLYDADALPHYVQRWRCECLSGSQPVVAI